MPVVENVEENLQPDQVALHEAAASVEETSVQKKDGSANNSYEDMESLLINEDDDDEPLGTENLRMSASEGEDGEKVSPMRRKKRAPKILDSDEEDGGGQKAKEVEDPPNDEGSKKEDSESEHIAYKPKKFSTLIDSESEPEETADEIVSVRQTQARISNLIDSESDNKETNENEATKVARKSKKKEKSRISKRPDSDSSDATQQESSRRKKVSDLIDSDSESSVASDGEDVKEPQDQENEPQKKRQRASAKKAINEMQAIQSETQRLYRETQVSIPYHKPKRHTLKEFLTRRTIEKPKVGQFGSGKKLKMSAEELEAYAKHLEERAKEATEFFKSESEDELVDNTQGNNENEKEQEENVTKEVPETPVTEYMEVETSSEFTKAIETEEFDTFLDQEIVSQPSTQELLNIEMPQESFLASEPIASTSSTSLDKQPEPKSPPSTSKSLSELKRRLIADHNLPANPTLKGDPNMIIDFETGDMLPPKPTGLESLFQRFVKSNAHNKKKPKEGSSILSTENNKIEVSFIEEPNKEKEPKPGAAYVKLKENLRSLITKKRKEDFQKKIEETQEEEEEYNKCCGFDEEEEEKDNKSERRPKVVERDIVIDEEENEIELEDVENDDEDLEESGDKDEEQEECEKATVDDEEVDGNDDDENESESDEEEDEEEHEDQSTRKHRVIRAFEDSDNENDEVDTRLNTTSTSVLFAEEAEKNPEEVENELLGLCSGQFEESQRAPLISQIPVTQTPGIVHDTELMDLCSGVFNEESEKQNNEVTEEKQKQKNAMKILSSDEKEQEEEQSDSDMKKVKKLKKRKKKRAKLGFSDDEDEESAEEDLQDSYEENEDEIPQTFIDYDSEENEIEVQMSKKECRKEANTFFEKEAELSESEWGSADEDEANLDKYDIELGDEDEFDREKIHTELEQIHMRKILDDDIREVKKIQDMLFDNEEVDGVGRQRQFRWKNIESGFSLDDPAGGGDNNNEEIDSADDEEEMKWRKMRFDREQLLKQKTKEEILAEVSATTLGRSLLSTMKPDIKSGLVYTKEVLVAKEYKAPSFLIAQCDVKSMKGSLLNYDKETLARIAATVTKSGVPNGDEQIQQKASKTGNFVFAPLSEEEQMIRKRKAEEAENAKNGNDAKKRKPYPQSSKSLLLDKLL